MSEKAATVIFSLRLYEVKSDLIFFSVYYIKFELSTLSLNLSKTRTIWSSALGA